MYRSLSKYIQHLESEGELVRIKAPVNPVLEIAEITDRVSKDRGKALLFEKTGTDFPVVTNLFGSDRRMAMALGADSLDDVPARLSGIINRALSPKGSLSEKLKAVPLIAEAAQWFPKRVSGRGECQQVVLRGEKARLSLLPILKCWPCDGGCFITLPLVHTMHPHTGAPNVGMYRMQILDDHTTGMHWHIHKTGARHYEAYKKRDISHMPVSVCIGGDPAYTYAATAPMPEGMDEYILAAFLRRRPVRLVRCLTNDIYVPSDCDFVIEGYVDTSQPKHTEGPFGDHTGFYSLEDLYPVFHVTAITHRRDAVYPATVVGIPPEEDAFLGKATEKIFLPPIQVALQPEVCDLHMPEPGVAHNLAIVSLDAEYRSQSQKVANALWGAGQMMFNKYMVAVPANTNIRDENSVAEWFRRIDPQQNLLFGSGVLDVLDHATAVSGYGGKLLVDATGTREDRPLTLPSGFSPAGGIRSADPSLAEKWRLLIGRADPRERVDVSRFLSANPVGGINAIAVFDLSTEGLTPYELLWLGTANTDPARDISISDGIAVVDCRSKICDRQDMPQKFPNVVTMDEATIARVDERWDEYRLGEMIVSPSLRYRRLLLSEKAEV